MSKYKETDTDTENKPVVTNGRGKWGHKTGVGD